MYKVTIMIIITLLHNIYGRYLIESWFLRDASVTTREQTDQDDDRVHTV